VQESADVDGLYLALRSYADMDDERARAVGRAFDSRPLLRPLKVGRDPARIKVGNSLEARIAERGLPLEWLTVRRSGRWPDFEGGEMNLMPGRGGWTGTPTDDGGWGYLLTGHSVLQHWLRATMAEPEAVTQAAGLFEDLAVAMEAAYGYVVAEARRPGGVSSHATRQLPGVFWLNYFGPAFLERHPRLAAATGARMLPSGGVLVRTTDLPWQPIVDAVPEWQHELRAILGEVAFQVHHPNPGLPTVEQHLAAAPGASEMPWEEWQRRKASDQRAKRYAAARRRLATGLQERPEPVLPGDAIEWSTSIDLPDWPDFVKHVTRRLGGELRSAVGKAALAVVATAPLDEEDGVVLTTARGVVRLSWFVDDADNVDIYLRGSPEAVAACDAWLT
jgi:hypothetical protein